MMLYLKKILTMPCRLPKILVTELTSNWFENENPMFITAKLDTLSPPMVFLKYVFNLLKHKKDCSAEHDLTGILDKMQTIFEATILIHASH